MICQEVMELMQRYVDHDLNEQETSSMMSHVEHCPDCAAMLDRLRRLTEGLMQLPKVTPPYSLVDAILPQLDLNAVTAANVAEPATAASEASPLGPRGRSARPYRGLLGRIAGVAALGIAIGALIFNQPLKLGPGGSKEADSADSSAPMASASNKAAAEYNLGAELDVPEAGGITQRTKKMPYSPEPSSLPSSEPSVNPSSQMTDKNEAASDAKGYAPLASSDESAAPEEQRGYEAADNSQDAKAKGGGVDASSGGSANEVEDRGEMTVAGALEPPPAIMSMSPDRKWKTVAIPDGRLRILKEPDDTFVFETPVRYGMPTDLVWSEDGTQLSYVFTDKDGNKAGYVFDVTTGIETKR